MQRVIRNCPVAVVGGAGFLGSHLVNHLVEERGCTVLVIDNLVAGRREFIHPKACFIHHDITTSEEAMLRWFRQYKIEYVFNYAAYPYIPVSFERPLQVFNVNANGAIKVINAAQAAGAKAILQVSSAEIYGDSHCPRKDDSWGKIKETAPVTPHSTYGVAKAAVDAYVQCAWKERQTPCVALRQFNCVGERETHPYVIPEIISQLSEQNNNQSFFDCPKCKEKRARFSGDKICAHCRTPIPDVQATVRLGNNSTRDFMYAGDAVRLAVELLETGEFGEVYNLGSETGTHIYDLADKITRLMGFRHGCTVETDEARKRPWEIWHLQSDNTKLYAAISETKRRPADVFTNLAITPLDVALQKTIAWYRENGCRWPWEAR